MLETWIGPQREVLKGVEGHRTSDPRAMLIPQPYPLHQVYPIDNAMRPCVKR